MPRPQSGSVSSTQLGGVIRARRTERSLTLAAVADRTGLSPSFLSQLENGRTNTSLRSLQVIAEVLSTTAADLLAEAGEDDVVITRADDPTLALPLSDEPSGATARARRLVHGRRALRALELSGQVTNDRPFTHRHDEIMYVVSGAVVATLGEPPETAELGPGDTLYITAQTVHRWRGLTDDTKVVLLSIADDRRLNRA
ncbi:helix-turn-helix domain-containing protein [Aeromicrobium sp. CnD17-E]|uniref:helix-turn-helix domain-containing protein n=1 Tax=Aeromicrobium sp. CnD17-E TaxID=2954487 RepID=UPI002097E9A8|nr:XRE family transcriptional regulator [Aeromicrobium sp. CnD17-E]MCO7239925.1 XRE family transcriptional regulator [Aeromicrobium sp. CnD17-E]